MGELWEDWDDDEVTTWGLALEEGWFLMIWSFPGVLKLDLKLVLLEEAVGLMREDPRLVLKEEGLVLEGKSDSEDCSLTSSYSASSCKCSSTREHSSYNPYFFIIALFRKGWRWIEPRRLIANALCNIRRLNNNNAISLRLIFKKLIQKWISIAIFIRRSEIA